MVGTVDFVNQSSNENTYSWDFGDQNGDNISDPSHTYSMSGIYEVELIVSNACGADTITQEVTVEIIDNDLSANFSLDDGTGCTPWVVNFSDMSTGIVDSFSWIFEGGNPATSTAQNPQVIYSSPGILMSLLRFLAPKEAT